MLGLSSNRTCLAVDQIEKKLLIEETRKKEKETKSQKEGSNRK